MILLLFGVCAAAGPDYSTDHVMFYQENKGGLNGVPGEDINVRDAWNEGLYGENVRISVIGSGCRATHHDFGTRVTATKNFDDSSTNVLTGDSSLGTNILAAAGAGSDSYGTVGIAQRASLSYYVATTTLADAVKYAATNDHVVVLPLQDIKQSDSLNEALSSGTAIYVAPAGDSAVQGHDANANWFAKGKNVITVGSSTIRGASTWYSNPGSNVLVNAPTSGSQYELGILKNFPTVRLAGAYDDDEVDALFAQTNIAAAQVAGVVALMKGVNPNLNRCDVALILALTATVNDPWNREWVMNAARNKWHPQLGFGRVDAWLAVDAARSWVSIPEEITTTESQSITLKDSTQVLTFEVSGEGRVEWAGLSLATSLLNMKGVKIVVRSPSGTQIEVVRPTPRDNFMNEVGIWGFLGESAAGTWTVEITNYLPETITFSQVQLTVHRVSNLPAYLRRRGSSSEIVEYKTQGMFSVSVPDSWTCGNPLSVTTSRSYNPLMSQGPFAAYITDQDQTKRIPLGEFKWGSRLQIPVPCFAEQGTHTYDFAFQFEPFNWTIAGSFTTTNTLQPEIKTPVFESGNQVRLSWVSAGHVAPSRRVYIQIIDKATSRSVYSAYVLNTGEHLATLSSSARNIKVTLDQGSVLVWDDGYVPTTAPTASPRPTREPTTRVPTPMTRTQTTSYTRTQTRTATTSYTRTHTTQWTATASPTVKPSEGSSGGGLSTSGKVAVALVVIVLLAGIGCGVAFFFLRNMWRRRKAETSTLIEPLSV